MQEFFNRYKDHEVVSTHPLSPEHRKSLKEFMDHVSYKKHILRDLLDQLSTLYAEREDQLWDQVAEIIGTTRDELDAKNQYTKINWIANTIEVLQLKSKYDKPAPSDQS